MKTLRKSKRQYIHKNLICIGDTIEHPQGELKTISNASLKETEFMGRTIFGDSYRLGTRLVCKVTL